MSHSYLNWLKRKLSHINWNKWSSNYYKVYVYEEFLISENTMWAYDARRLISTLKESSKLPKIGP